MFCSDLCISSTSSILQHIKTVMNSTIIVHSLSEPNQSSVINCAHHYCRAFTNAIYTQQQLWFYYHLAISSFIFSPHYISFSSFRNSSSNFMFTHTYSMPCIYISYIILFWIPCTKKNIFINWSCFELSNNHIYYRSMWLMACLSNNSDLWLLPL